LRKLLKGKRVAVTGGAGFIGSHLVEELYENNEVIILDDLSSGRLENIKPFLSSQKIRFVEGSVTDLPLLLKIFQDTDYVFHQAALSSAPLSVADPLPTFETNIRGTLNVLLAARDNNVTKVICASSSSIYGDCSSPLQREDLAPNPLSPYAVTKLSGEFYCNVFKETYGLNTAFLRYFNVYGPRQDPRSRYAAVIPIFINRLLAGKPPVIYGDGEQTRDFIFVKDVVQANILAAVSDITGPVNIGSGQTITVNKLAVMLIALTKKYQKNSIRPLYLDPRPADPRHSRADINKARSIGFKPKYTLKEGLKFTWDYFSKQKIFYNP
jgi:UDP-glucose 4-epimerase